MAAEHSGADALRRDAEFTAAALFPSMGACSVM
jgi:hypothetical protein